MRRHLRTFGMIILVMACGAVALVMNLGVPARFRDASSSGPVRAEPEAREQKGELPERSKPNTVNQADQQSAKFKPKKGLKLVWHDEFAGPRGARPSARNWKIESGTPGTGEKQVNTPKNVGLDGRGNLVILARKQRAGEAPWTSARITTEGRFHTTYGRIEGRIRTPGGRGLMPAFWLLGTNFREKPWPDCGEIDIMERRGDLRDRTYATVQGPGYSGVGISRQYSLGPGGDFADAFHVFAADWTPNRIVFTVDGHKVHTVSRGKLPGVWVFDHPFFIVLNLAVGNPFSGDPDAGTVFPAQLTVDYVRAYKYTKS